MERDCNNCRFEHYNADEIPCIACGIDEREQWQPKAKTNADHFREAISTEDGLAKFLMKVNDDGIYIPFCQNKEECWELIEENGVPEEKCMECMKEWMRKPYEWD